MTPSTEKINALVDELKAQLGDSVILTPESPGYAESIKRWADSAEKKAAVCVMGKSAEDISKALLAAQKYNVDIAVRGGGHAPSGSGSSEGLVVDLSQMRQVTVDVDNKTATCQGGCLWEDVDQALGRHGLAIVGGTVSHTGIGGLTLGGGYGWLSGRYGLSIDNLVSVKVVLADGRIVTSSKTENPDLFWALRGAGHNFGVSVEFTYQAHDLAHEVYAGLLLFTPDKLEKIISFCNAFRENPNEDASAIMIFGQPPGHPTPVIAYALFYNGPEELDPKFARRVFDKFTTTLEQNPELQISGIIWEFHDLSKIGQIPQTATAFAKRGPQLNVSTAIEHYNPDRHDESLARGREIQNMFKEEMAKSGQGHVDGSVDVYANYVDEPQAEIVFGPNLERLGKLKGKYDPTNVFNKTHPITPVFDN